MVFHTVSITLTVSLRDIKKKYPQLWLIQHHIQPSISLRPFVGHGMLTVFL